MPKIGTFLGTSKEKNHIYLIRHMTQVSYDSILKHSTQKQP